MSEEKDLRYVVLVECKDEIDQQRIYEMLKKLGLSLKVLVG